MAKQLAFISITLLSLFLVSFSAAVPVSAADFRNGETVTISSEETVNDDLYLIGTDVTVDGIINGDLVVLAQRITINGTVNGNTNVCGRNITLKGVTEKTVRAAGTMIIVSGNVKGDLMAVGESIVLAKGGSVGRDVVAAGSTISLEGPVSGHVKSNSSKLTISGSVGGNVEVETVNLRLEPSASINGNLEYTSNNKAVIAEGSSVKGQTTYHSVEKEKQPAAPSGEKIGQAIGAAMSAVMVFIISLILVISLIKYVAALLTGIILIVIFQKQLNEINVVLKQKPWPSLGWGAMMVFLAPVAIFIAFILIIGIPLGVVALAIYIACLYLGHIIIALFLGQWILRMGDGQASTGQMIGALALGLLIVYIFGLIPFIACFTDLAVLLFGAGTIVLYVKTKLISPGKV